MNRSIHSAPEEILLHLLTKEHGYYRTVWKIACEENHKLKEQRPFSEVQPLLRQKQILLSSIQSIDQALSPLKRLWQEKKEQRGALSSKIQKELLLLNDLLDKILALDTSSKALAEESIRRLKHKYNKQMEA